LVEFATTILKVADGMSKTFAGQHLSGQLIRSATSAALNYGEAQGGESSKDFVHKIKVVLKELRETLVCLKIIHRSTLHPSPGKVAAAIKECNELVSIFVKSAKTAQANMN
jgi:four helix bundle protein